MSYDVHLRIIGQFPDFPHLPAEFIIQFIRESFARFFVKIFLSFRWGVIYPGITPGFLGQ